MADVELVIKIPKFIYDQILKSHVSKKTITKIFSNATLLPKGHGGFNWQKWFVGIHGH